MNTHKTMVVEVILTHYLFRMIQQNFIDMENMFDLLNEDQEVSAAT